MKTHTLMLPSAVLASLALLTPCSRAGFTTDPLGLHNGILTYAAAPGAANTVTLAEQNGRVILTDSTAPLPPCPPIPGMQRPNPFTISLPAGSVASVSVDLGDRDDRCDGTSFSKPLNIVGGDGSDFLRGGAGVDTICGGNGNDSLHGDDGDDTITGGPGDDTICGGNGNDSLHGDDDHDIAFGGPGDDTICGGNGNDSLHGDDGADDLWGGGGTDEVRGGTADAQLDGGDGPDMVSIGFPQICGGADDDQLTLPPVSGGEGHDVLSIEGRGVSPAREAELLQVLPGLGFEELEVAGE